MASKEDAGSSKPGRITVSDAPKFDLDSYIANYEGPTRLERLLCIGTSSTYLHVEATKAAVAEAKRGKNVGKYMEAIGASKVQNSKTPSAAPDLNWVDTKQRQVKAETDRLEGELKGYKNNLIKESIRMGNEELGAFYYDIGDYFSASKAYTRMREYCTTPKHVSELSQKLLLVAIAQGNWMAVTTNVYKIQNLGLKPEDKSRISPLLAPLLGLADMASGNYRSAAIHFLATDPAFINLEPSANGVHLNRQVLTANDIATYGGLCALASMDRAELSNAVLDSASFRNFLELEPHIRRAVTCFCGSKYTQALAILESYRIDYLLDIYLQNHVKDIYSQIRRKSVVAYFRPFSRVELSVMAEAFSTTSEELEEDLVEMIRAGFLDARVDLVERVLVATKEDQRAKVHERALKMAGEREKALRLRLFKINMQAAGLEMKAPKQSAFDGRGMGMAGGRRGKDDLWEENIGLPWRSGWEGQRKRFWCCDLASLGPGMCSFTVMTAKKAMLSI